MSDGEAALTNLQDVVDVLEESIQHTEPSSVQSTPRSVRSQASTLKKYILFFNVQCNFPTLGRQKFSFC